MTDRLDAPAGRSRSRGRPRRHPVDDPYAEDAPEDADWDSPDQQDDAPPPDYGSLVPARLREAVDRLRVQWTVADSLATAVVGAQLLVTTLETLRGSFYQDDLPGQVEAAGHGFGSYVVETDGGFTPLANAVEWVLVQVAPLQHGPVVALTFVVRLLLGLVAWRLLRRLFGAGALAVLPLAVLLFTPALLPATLWYGRLVTAGLATLAVVWALEALLRWSATRSMWALAQVPIATAAGLACAEQAAVLPAGLLAVALVLFAGRRPAAAAPPAEAPVSRAAARRARATVAVAPARLRPALVGVALSALVAVPIVVVQLGATGAAATPAELVRLAGRIANTAFTMLAGGPWRWAFDGAWAGVPDLPPVALVALWAVVAAVAVVLLITGSRRHAVTGGGAVVRAALLGAVWLGAAAWAAATFPPAGAAGDPALQPDRWSTLVPGLVLAVGLAALPWAEGVRAVHPRITEPAARQRVTVITAPAMAAGLVVLVGVVGAGISTVGWVGRWWENPTGGWLTNVETSVSQAEPYARVLATPLPEKVLPADRASALMATDAPLLRMIRPDLRFHDGDGTSRHVNRLGVLSPIYIAPLGRPNGRATCVRIPAGDGWTARVRLAAPAPYRPGAQVQVGVLLSEATRVAVEIQTSGGRWTAPLRYSDDELSGGAHTLHLPVPAGVAVAAVRVGTAGTRVGCLTDVQVWAPIS